MDIPDLPPPDIGDLGSTPPRLAPLPLDPLPARSSSPPLPPRKNAQGLPPTYLTHLRALLHQWLEQQRRPDETPVAGDGSAQTRLWDDQRLNQIGEAIWKGAVIPDPNVGQRHLLELDWTRWASGAARRKLIWKETHLKKKSPSRDKRDPHGKARRTHSINQDEAPKDLLSAPPTAAAASLSMSTPQRSSTRSASSVSPKRSADTTRTPSVASPAPASDAEDAEDAKDQTREFYRFLTKMKGFQKLVDPNQDEWEVLDGKGLPPVGDREFPGAFPQAAHFREPSLPLSAPPALPPKEVTPTDTLSEVDLIKPVICAHFPAAPSEASTKTLHLRGRSSLDYGSAADLARRGSGTWWGPPGSSRRWSALHLGLGRDAVEQVVVEFIENKFALPSEATSSTSPERTSSRPSLQRNRRSGSHPSDQGLSAIVSSSASSDTEDHEHSSTWSGTLRGGSHMTGPRARSHIVAGDEDDLPRREAEKGKVCIVGGTVVIRGINRDDERAAVLMVLRVLIYAIQAMTLELELLDAFRVPREPDPLATASKPTPPHRQNTSPLEARSRSPSLRRNKSMKERGSRAKGFFHRLSKDTRGMLDGLMGRNKSSEPSNVPLFREDTKSSTSTITPMRSSTANLSPDPLLSSAQTDELRSLVPQSIDRHLRTLKRLDKILPSTSPLLRVPMPPILLRVKEEERVHSEKACQEAVADVPAHRPANEATDGLTRRPSIRTVVRDHSFRVRARGYRLGGDVRAGLGALAPGMDEFEGWRKLQRLDMLVSSGLESGPDEAAVSTICERPKPVSYVFWGKDDESIEEVFDALSDTEQVCPRPGCDLEQEQHVKWYFHNQQKMAVRVRKVEQGMGENGLDVWVKCRVCKKTSEPRRLGALAGSFSWGKLLELIFYTTILCPADFCPDASAIPSNLTIYIRSPHIILSLSTQAVSVLDARLPKLQVGPNVSKRKAGRSAAMGAAQNSNKDGSMAALLEALRSDVEMVMRSLRRDLALATEFMDHTSLQPTPEGSVKGGSVEASEDPHTMPTSPSEVEGIELALQDAETSLRDHIGSCSQGGVNDVRCKIRATYDRLHVRISALSKLETANPAKTPDQGLPEYFGNHIHAIPGSSVLIREDEPSSVIAYTLSSLAYFTELTTKGKAQEDQLSPEQTKESKEGWSVQVQRKETPRDILSLRTITKKRSDASMIKMEHRLPLTVTPNQPSLELSLEQVEGKSQASDRLDDLVRSISKATAQDPILTINPRAPSPSVSESDNEPHTKRLPSSLARRTSTSGKAVPPSAFRTTRSVSSTIPTESSLQSPRVSSANMTPRSVTPSQEPSKEGWASVTSTFTNSFNSLLKIGSDVGSLRSKNGDRSLSSLMGPLSMMSAMDNSLSNSGSDDRPHLQFTYTLADKLTIGCTVYYASAFDSLRRRCAIDRSIIDSLSRCESWDAQGGKSKASFFMTRDKRYIVKELVSKWNVSDTQALLEIAPSYFEYLANTHNKATCLAKIVAFTTIKIHDVQSSSKKSMDLMVMENLFYKQDISQTYDLKGIEGRKVPKAMADGSTLFDSEWIEGQSRAPILLHPHAKRILQEAIYNDTKYLCSQSIMDYSLLLGLDNVRHEIVVGLVDAIGSFNLFKTIESRSKLALTRGGEVTIVSCPGDVTSIKAHR